VYRFINRNFSIERLNELKSERAKQSRQKSSANLIYVDGKPWEEEGISKSWYYEKQGKASELTGKAPRPWEILNMSERTYYRRKSAGKL
ncbi:hypothetical protein, partial [Pseudomonas aeruginosa]